ncbi:MAG: Fe(2+) transporter permease subunit FeoB [Alphaproteobacteria bacterium]
MSDFHLAVIGNPNCGKTTFFNALTGSRQRVGNWPGVTVDRKQGFYSFHGKKIEVIDLPGVYSLSDTTHGGLDERVARDYILSQDADVIVNVVDASNLQRNLYLTTQILEMGVPLILVLNMCDIAQKRGIHIDADRLSKKLGCPVVSTVSSRRKGIELFKNAVDLFCSQKNTPVVPRYHEQVEHAIESTLNVVAQKKTEQHAQASRWLSLQLLEGDENSLALVSDEERKVIETIRSKLEDALQESADLIIADCRYSYIHSLMREIVVQNREKGRTFSDKVDDIILSRFLGIPVFLGIMYIMFLATINFASAFIDFFDIAGETLFVGGSAHLLSMVNAPEWLYVLISSGVGGGIQTVLTFVPVISFLFLFLTFLEDSGYMARAAFVMDNVMRAISLPGKAFVPMILGFGCTVPAVMAARTLESRRDRIMTAMMAPFVSCGARLPVYVLFAAAFFPHGGQNIVFALYILGIVFAVLTGVILKRTVLRGETEPFIMELPPYNFPTARSLLMRTWHRLSAFFFNAGKIVVLIVVLMSFLNSLGFDGSFGNENTEKSLLAQVGKGLSPVVSPMGISEENWPATVGLFTGIFAKEVIVGTLDALYSQNEPTQDYKNQAQDSYSLFAGLGRAFASIPPNVTDAFSSFSDPLSIRIGSMDSLDDAAKEQGVSVRTFGSMIKYFGSPYSALAYLVMILLYMPCVAAIATIYRETSALWTIFVALWSTGLGYGSAVLTFQTATFFNHPASSLVWIISILGSFVFCVFILHLIGRGVFQWPAQKISIGGKHDPV